MKKKISFEIDSAMKLKLDDYTKKQNLNLTKALNYIISCHFEKIEHGEENSLKRIEDKLDSLLLQESKPKDSIKNKDNYQKIIQFIIKNAQNFEVIGLIELMDIIPELKTIIDN
ncbi:hypothetical protein MHK_009070 [Candidatus Magnetomorum sp. HK-1]|nr:hypothetical protein MHK_009070 [Candidatus Magnetomorum sp. HK-1]